MEPEPIEHMLSCTSEATKEYKASQRKKLKHKITNIGTPEDITASILHEIEHWEVGIYDPSSRQ